MKAKIEVETSKIKEFGPTVAVALAIVQASVEPMTNTELAHQMGISFPTAQKALKILEESGHVKEVGKAYRKI